MGLLLPVLGFVSGLLSYASLYLYNTVTTDGAWWYIVTAFPGLLFGVFVAFYFTGKSILKRAAFVFVSGVAYWVAYFVGSMIGACASAICGFPGDPQNYGGFGSSSPGPFHLSVASLAGGVVGASILSFGFIFLISSFRAKFSLLYIVLIGGALGVIGFLPGALIWGSSAQLSFVFLFPVWQTGMAIALKYFTSDSRLKPNPTP